MIFERGDQRYSLEEFEKLTGTKWLSQLHFESPKLLERIQKKTLKLHQKGEMTLEQMWLGTYFQKEMHSNDFPDVAIRWIDSILGWGVFALRDFRKMEFIAEYVGVIRKSKRADKKNAYCFEYPISSAVATPYTIDAREKGGLGRYINHGTNTNLNASLATVGGLGHIILYTKQFVAKGSQFFYDYGPTYWSKRPKPLPL